MGAEGHSGHRAEDWEPQRLLAHRYRVKQCLRESASCNLYRIQDVFRNDFHLALRASPRVLAHPQGASWFTMYCDQVLEVPGHPNLLQGLRTESDEGETFLVMEDLEGECLDVLVRAGHLTDLRSLLDVAIQTGRGLAWLHRHDSLHYNMKPANVLLSHSGVAKLWKYCETGAKTRAFGSPEQLGRGAVLTPATDVWSWAATVLFTFVGKVGWSSGSDVPRALRRYLRAGPALEGVALMPGPVADMLDRCLQIEPDDRPDGMAELTADLERVYEDAVGEAYDGPEHIAAPGIEVAPVPEADEGELLEEAEADQEEVIELEEEPLITLDPERPPKPAPDVVSSPKDETVEEILSADELLTDVDFLDEAEAEEEKPPAPNRKGRGERWTARRNGRSGRRSRPHGPPPPAGEQT